MKSNSNKKITKNVVRNIAVTAASIATASILSGCGELYGGNNYIVSFETNGGNEIANLEYKWGEEMQLPENPTREGYTFAGWYLDAKFKTPLEDYVISGDICLYAKWTINKYTVSFNSNGGNEINSVTKNYGSTVTVDDPEREGYNFAGWYLDPALTRTFDGVVPADNIIVYAKWNACELTITFDKNADDATGSMDNQIIKNESSNNKISSCHYERVGYSFVGWATSSDGDVVYQAGSQITSVKQDRAITLYARWEANAYSVTFIANSEEYYSYQAKYDQPFVLPTANPLRTGYTFKGWGTHQITSDTTFDDTKIYYRNIGTTEDPMYEIATVTAGASVEPNTFFEIIEYTDRQVSVDGIVLHAIFTRNGYSISFNTNGGTPVNSISALYGAEIAKPQDPTRTGYNFVAWYTKDGTSTGDWGEEYGAFTTMPSKDIVLYAKWEIKKFVVTFNTNGGSSVSSLEKDYATELVLPLPVKEGHDFLGWATTQDGEVVYDVDDYYVFLKSETLHAVWEINEYTINFNTNGGTNISSITKEFGDNVLQPNDPTKVGYTFVGWYSDEACTQVYIFSTMPSSNTTVYAKWSINKYTVDFVENGGTPVEDITQDYATEVVEPADPTRTGHTFTGWYLDEACTEKYEFSTMPSKNVTLYAGWSINEYTISFVENGGSEVKDITQKYQSVVLQPANPTKVGYTFLGWFTKNGEATSDWGEEYIFTTMPAENVDLYAKWTINSYTINFVVNGGTAVESITQNYATAVTAPTAPVKTGYTFTGWYKDAELTEAYDFTTMPAEDVTVYVGWEARTDTKYTVNHYGVNLDGTGYILLKEEVLEGTTDALTNAEYRSSLDETSPFYGFVGVETIVQSTVNPEGTTVINLRYQRQTYKVVFVDVDGVQLHTTSVIYQGILDIIPSELARTGYDIILSDGFTASTEILRDIEIVVTYDAIETSISFYNYPSVGNESIGNLTLDYGTDVSEMVPTPVRTGYTFLGWFTKNGEETSDWGEEYIFTTMPAENVDLYAKWTINSYTINFVVNGGSAVESITQNYATAVTAPSNPSKVGHTFAGWYKDAECTETYEFTTMPAEDVTVYVGWVIKQYTITLDTDGGTAIAPITQNYGTAVTTPSNPSKVGHTFAGWYSDEACTQSYTFTTIPAANTTVYAKWTVNQYTINFVVNGGTAIVPITQDYATAVTRPDDPTKVGYTFAGWYTDSTFKKVYNFSEMPAENITVYAKWIVNQYTIYFEENGGTTVSNIKQDFNTSVTKPNDPSKTGYTFTGWYKDAELTKAFEFDKMPSSDTTLYAGWEINEYTITLNTDGGTNIDPIKQDYNTDVVRPDDPTKVGYTFVGWYTDLTFTKVYNFSTMPAQDVNIYAKWNINSYYFTLVDDGIVTSHQRYEYGTEIELHAMSRTGYVFKGWSLIQDGEVKYVPNTKINLGAENTTLYAVWGVVVAEYTFLYKSDLVDTNYTARGEYDTEFIMANPKSYNDGSNIYYFVGWREQDASGNLIGNLYDFSTGAKFGDVNKTYVAIYTSKPFTVKYQATFNGTTLWETLATAGNTSFTALIANLYAKQAALQFVTDAIELAVGGDIDDIGAAIAFGKVKCELISQNVLDYVKDEQQIYYMAKGIVEARGISPEAADFEAHVQEMISPCTAVYNVLNAIDEQAYFAALMNFNNKDETKEALKNATSDGLTMISSELKKYEDNAYNPVRNGYIFNGWNTSVDTSSDNPIKYVYATWVKPIEAPTNVRVLTIAKNSVSFTWDEVEGAYGYYVTYSINGGNDNVIATRNNEVTIEVSNEDTITVNVITINSDSNGNRFEESNEYTVTSLVDPNKTFTQESVSLNSEKSQTISYTHIITGEQEITSEGNFFYMNEAGELFLFANSSYTFKEVVDIEIISGSSFASINTTGEKPALVTGSNAGIVEFVTYKPATGVAKAGENYYEYTSNGYILVNVAEGESVTNYYIGEHRHARISQLVSNISLGKDLHTYSSAATSGEYLNTTEFDGYLIGAALTDSSLYTEYTYGGYSNGFKFDFDVNTTSGNILDVSTFPVIYTFYELNDEGGWDKVEDPSSLYVYDEEQDVFYFLKSSGDYKVVISYKKDGFYPTKDTKVSAGKQYYVFADGKYTPTDDGEFQAGTTYYEQFVNTSIPKAYKDRTIETEFMFTLNTGINVFDDYGLKQVFSESSVSSINLHKEIEAEFNSNSIAYIPYMVDAGLSSSMAHSQNGELDIVSGTAIMSTDSIHGPLCWSISTEDEATLKANGTFYFLDTDGIIYVYNRNGEYAIKDCEWKQVYGNPQNGLGKFKIINIAYGSNSSITSAGLQVASIYIRDDKESLDLTVNGNYFTIDGSDLPFVMSKYKNVAGTGIVATYSVQNVSVSMIDIVSGTKVTIENLSLKGNTENASVHFDTSSGETVTIAEIMEKTSGGIIGVKTNYVDSTIVANNVNISNTTIAFHSSYLSNASVTYARIWESWANSFYGHGVNKIEVSHSEISSSGGASFHVEDIFYTYDKEATGLPYPYDDGNIVANSGVITNPTLSIDYTTTSISNNISGEEQWFKAYSMEIVALGMKSMLEDGAKALSAATGTNYTILVEETDPITNLTTQKMNFVFLSQTHKITQDAANKPNYQDILVNFGFGDSILGDHKVTEKGILYTIGNISEQGVPNVLCNVLITPLDDVGNNFMYTILSADGTKVIKSYMYFTHTLDTKIYGMVELFIKEE